MTADFTGRRMLVTGGAKGIGKAAALRFLAGGAQVACLDMDEAALAELEPGFLALNGDVTDTASVEEAVAKAAARLGGLDGIVNSAGVDLQSSLEDMTDAAWERLIAVNLTGPMKVCRAALPFLKAAGGGTIVNVSSNATRGIRRVPYSAAKGGVNGLTMSIAMEYGEQGIRCVATAPGGTSAPPRKVPRNAEGDNAQEQAWMAEAVEQVTSSTFMKRYGTLDEQIAPILFLASDEAGYMTGSIMPVAGGDLG